MILLQASSLLLLALTQPTTPTENATSTELPPVEASTAALATQDAAAATDPKWTGDVNLGATLNTGNTENVTVAASMDAELKRQKDRHSVNLFWSFGETKIKAPGTPTATAITERKLGALYQYDYFVNDKTYYFGRAAANSDKLAKLDLRWLAGGGVGHQFRDEEDFKLSGEAGLVYINENYEEPLPPTPSADSEGISLTLGYDVVKTLTETTVFEQHTQIYPSLKDSSDVYARVDSQLKIKMTETMNARLQWILQWDNTPAPGLRSVDNQFIAGLSWGF